MARQPHKPLPELMTAEQVAAEMNLDIRSARNIVYRIAKAHGGPVEFDPKDGGPPIRRVFVEREWVWESIGRGKSR